MIVEFDRQQQKNGVTTMAKFVLEPGEAITVEIAGSDGEFTINYGSEDISVTANMPDTSGRVGLIYQERYGDDNLESATFDEAIADLDDGVGDDDDVGDDEDRIGDEEMAGLPPGDDDDEKEDN